jgi:hypothetical protein
MGAFDSSPVVVSIVNDLLVQALSARGHEGMLYHTANELHQYLVAQ